MKLQEAKNIFISTWGSLGSNWGINKAMAQIQALLFISVRPMTMEEIMEDLKISRGNASMNLRSLIDWGIVSKISVPGERKELYQCEKDVQELARIIAKERSRRELAPVVRTLGEISSIETDASKECQEFIKQTKALHELAETADGLLNKMANQKSNWFNKTLFKIFT